MFNDVRVYPGVPPAAIFSSSKGTPIVVDTTTNTAYYLLNGVVTAIGVLPLSNQPIRFVRNTANYVLILADVDGNTWIEQNLAGANTLTIPPHSSVAAPNGRAVLASQLGAGTVTVTPGAGVTLLPASSYTTRIQGACIGMIQVVQDTWYVFGNLT